MMLEFGFVGGDKLDIKYLYKELEKLNYKEFYKVEADFYMFLLEVEKREHSTLINTFLIVSNWFGTSLRSGVWTFYEATKKIQIQKTVLYLKEHNDIELAEIIEKGIFDYENPIYAENFDYPSEWMVESEKIDKWISNHIDWLRNWLYNFLLKNKEYIVAL